VVHVGLTKSTQYDVELLDCSNNAVIACDSSELAKDTRDAVVAALGSINLIDIRPTSEATMVLFDASSSMSVVWAEGDAITSYTVTSFGIGEEVEVRSSPHSSSWEFASVVEQGAGQRWIVQMQSSRSVSVISIRNVSLSI
jgi:hypothetical protein